MQGAQQGRWSRDELQFELSQGHGQLAMAWDELIFVISLGHGYPLPPWRREPLSPLHLPCHRACTIYVMTPENSNRASVLLCNIQ